MSASIPSVRSHRTVTEDVLKQMKIKKIFREKSKVLNLLKKTIDYMEM